MGSKALIIKSKFRLRPVFADKKNNIQGKLQPGVSISWLTDDIGELSSSICMASYLYSTEGHVTTWVEWLGREEQVIDFGGVS